MTAKKLGAKKGRPPKINYCRHCGHNISKDYPIRVNDFYIDWRGLIAYKETILTNMTATEICLIHTIANSEGMVVRLEVLANRCCGSSVSTDSIKVYIRAIRRKFRELEIPNHIAAVSAWSDTQGGYYWSKEPVEIRKWRRREEGEPPPVYAKSAKPKRALKRGRWKASSLP